MLGWWQGLARQDEVCRTVKRRDSHETSDFIFVLSHPVSPAPNSRLYVSIVKGRLL